MPSETWSNTYNCPCGAGTVTRTVVDYNKMYVPDDITISWNCTACEARYTQVLNSADGMLAIERNGTRVVLQSDDRSSSSEAD
jgi:hypothetical protein